jgi:hypothetical protein
MKRIPVLALVAVGVRRVRPPTPPACRSWMALVLGEGIAKPGAMAMGEDYKEQLDDFRRKMEKHRTKIREHTQETQEQVEKAEQRERNAEEPESPLSDRTE